MKKYDKLAVILAIYYSTEKEKVIPKNLSPYMN
jgi:hypothetical protein